MQSQIAALALQCLRRPSPLRRPTVRVNVYHYQRSAHSPATSYKGRCNPLRRRLSETRSRPATSSFNHNDIYKLSSTLRSFASSSDLSPPGQEPRPAASSDTDAGDAPTASDPLSPEDFDPDMHPLNPDFGPLGYPRLPIINNEETRLRVFTHRSLHARPASVFEDSPNSPSPDNEVLEHLGDSVLNFTVTSLINERYPHLRVGPATKVRAMVVGNKTLSGISVNYKLPGYLRLHHAQSASLKASVKVQADVFEAYVGGVYHDRGIEVARSWLYALFTPYVKLAYGIIRSEHGLPPLPEASLPSPDPSDTAHADGWTPTAHTEPPPPASDRTSLTGSTTTTTSDEDAPAPAHAHALGPNGTNQATGHLALFNQRIQKMRKTVEWNYAKEPGPGTRATPRWRATCMIDDVPIAMGMGTTKKAAQNVAAVEGLAKLDIVVD